MTNIHTITPHVRHVDAPPALRTLPAWLIWRFEANGEKKPRKVPYYAGGGRRAGVQGSEADVAGLVTFEAAKAAAARRGFDGVGFATLGQWGITALDFDDCMTPGGLHPEVAEVVASSYAEYSPSGKGVRAFFRGQLPTGKSHKQGDLPYGFEVFSTSGFVTFTGNALPECEILGTDDVVAELDDAVRALHARRFVRTAAAPAPDAPDIDRRTGATLDEIAATLDALDPDMGHDDWLAVGMGLHHELGHVGFELWNEWSSRGDKYPGSDTIEARWATFGRHQGPSTTWRTAQALAGHLHPAASPDEFPDATEQAAQAEAAEQAKPLRFQFEPVGQFASTQALPWIIKHVLPKAGLGVLYGESGAGKSFMALDMAMAIARGCEWRGRKVKQGAVAYIAAEGAGGFRKRVAAYGQHFEQDLGEIPMAVLGAAPNLMEVTDTKDVIRALRQVGQVVGRLAMVVVDTLAQTTPGANENAGEDMGKALGHCKRIHEATGAMVLLVHHSGKDKTKGARGWSGLRAACDAELEVIREGTARALRLTKSKDGVDDMAWGFTLETVTLGVDEDLDPITSCVVADAPLPAAGGQPLRAMGPVETIVNTVIQEMAQSQTEGIEVGPVIAESVKRLDPPADGRRDTRKQRVRRALEQLCMGDDAPYWLQDDGTLAVC